MNTRVQIPMKPGAAPARSLTPAPFGTLRRKCACGGSGSSGGECEECSKKQKSKVKHEFNIAPTLDLSNVRSKSAAEDAGGQSPYREGNSRPSARLLEVDSRDKQVRKKVFFCPPAPDSITNVSSAAGGGGTLGFTRFTPASQLVCAPQFTVDAKAGNCTFRPISVNLGLVSKFAAPTATPLPTKDTLRVPGCNQDVPVFMQITQAVSDLARLGEQEHCDDLNIAFGQTLAPCAAAVNKLAGQGLPGANADDCHRALVARLGFDPVDCSAEFQALARQDEQRDQQGLHDFDPVLISKDCTKVVVGNQKSAKNKIGDPSVAPSKFMPASTKCPRQQSNPGAGGGQPSPHQPGGGGGQTPPPQPKQ